MAEWDKGYLFETGLLSSWIENALKISSVLEFEVANRIQDAGFECKEAEVKWSEIQRDSYDCNFNSKKKVCRQNVEAFEKKNL